MSVSFVAEIRETKQRKASLDNVYSITLITDNSDILELGKLPPDTTVDVIISQSK